MPMLKDNHDDFYLLWMHSGFWSSSTTCMKIDMSANSTCEIFAAVISRSKFQLDIQSIETQLFVIVCSRSHSTYLHNPILGSYHNS